MRQAWGCVALLLALMGAGCLDAFQDDEPDIERPPAVAAPADPTPTDDTPPEDPPVEQDPTPQEDETPCIGGVGPDCAPDGDGDGIADRSDNCPELSNPTQGDVDLDLIGDACDPDADNDGIPQLRPDGRPHDNCPFGPNPDQADLDGDAIGDACEGDRDSDGVPDNNDNCPRDHNPEQLDHDGDGIGYMCDPTPGRPPVADDPGAGPGSDPNDPGTDPGDDPGSGPGSNPGNDPGDDPGSDPGNPPDDPPPNPGPPGNGPISNPDDTDGDGIPNDQDGCPDEPGVPADDGCPAEDPPPPAPGFCPVGDAPDYPIGSTFHAQFEVNYYTESLLVEITSTVVGMESVVSMGEPYNALRIDEVADYDGYFFGSPTEGHFEATHWVCPNSLAEIRSEFLDEYSSDGETYEEHSIIEWEAPCHRDRFDIEVGDSWSYGCTGIRTTTQDGDTWTQPTAESGTYQVEAEEGVTVGAGTFSAYRISAQDGVWGEYAYWMSDAPCGGFAVQHISDDGVLEGELVSYTCG